MGDGMPYHLEKGPLLQILESHLNSDRAGLQARLEVVRESERNDSLDWILGGVPELWQDPAFARGPQAGDVMRTRLMTEWFGYEEDGAGGWQKPQPPPSTTGYWIGYRGDVDKIVRTAVHWALELALATGSDAEATKSVEPWPIEIFWKCPAPWFEAWVVSRRVGGTDRGLVTIVLVSPSHRGATVSESPIARSPVATPPGAQHPVPSYQDDYEQLERDGPDLVAVNHPDPLNFPGRPRVPAVDRDYATWVVTHERHNVVGGLPPPRNGPGNPWRADEENTAGPFEFAIWSIPQLTVYEGSGDIVVVSPSMAAGGVKHDGSV